MPGHYQALARQWRPQTFTDIVGQEHVTKALTHALDNNRLHHAYLFTGTRGVGKTTLARILAKCLNCETKISATPCRQCNHCQAIEAGNFPDLLEIDGASNTKVEDTRDLLDNVQYLPTLGRYKIYLIDEVHMLSNHSFNALLKTLEEPPEHVIFLLATTDPDKLPITVLSRCLQFHLRKLNRTQISAQLNKILQAENISFEDSALITLADAADGSMRDALSLLDQAIAFSQANISLAAVTNMLGQLPSSHCLELIKAVAAADAALLFQHINSIAELGVDFEQTTIQLLELLQQIAVYQKLGDSYLIDASQQESIAALAKQIPANTLQLYYQMLLIGRRDLALAATPQSGFEMLMLRLLSFQPASLNPNTHNKNAAPVQKTTAHKPTVKSAAQTVPTKPTINTPAEPIAAAPTPPPITNRVEEQTTTKPIPPAAPTAAADMPNAIDWHTLYPKLNLSAVAKLLAENCVLTEQSDEQLKFALARKHGALLNAKTEQTLAKALSEHYGRTLKIAILCQDAEVDSPAERRLAALAEDKKTAVTALENDAQVRAMLETFSADLQTDSVKLND